MSKELTIKLTKASPKTGPFNIYDQFGNIIAENVSKDALINGVSYIVDDSVSIVSMTSIGKCENTKIKPVTNLSPLEVEDMPFTESLTGCLWRHLTNTNDVYNKFYGIIYPFILEYPFAFQYNDQLIQSIKNYSKVYEYRQDTLGVFSYTDKIELDDKFFNKLIVYNGQQSSGLLILVPKPKNNLKEYMKYPIYNTDSKTVIFTKSDNFYNINTFWDVVKDRTEQLFITSCESLSIDREINQDNMIYTQQSFKKSPIRAKDCKIRLILDDDSTANVVSQFIIASHQISYK